MDDNDDPRCMFANILMIISVDQRNPFHKYLDTMEVFLSTVQLQNFASVKIMRKTRPIVLSSRSDDLCDETAF